MISISMEILVAANVLLNLKDHLIAWLVKQWV